MTWEEKDWIWFAGFIDGEGTLTINTGLRSNGRSEKKYARFEPRIAVSNNEKELMQFMSTYMNGVPYCKLSLHS